jgi:hypothetical protein
VDAQQESGNSSRTCGNSSSESGGSDVPNGIAGTVLRAVCVARQGERISLTIRRVLKVHKALGLLKR